MAQSVNLRMAKALLGIRERREASAKEARARTLAGVAAAETVLKEARARLIEAVERSKRTDAEFRERIAGGLVSAAAFDSHRSAQRRIDEHIGEAVAAFREAEAEKARAEAEAEAARVRHVQALRSVDVGKTIQTRLAKAVSAKQETVAETDIEDLTIARFVREGSRP